MEKLRKTEKMILKNIWWKILFMNYHIFFRLQKEKQEKFSLFPFFLSNKFCFALLSAARLSIIKFSFRCFLHFPMRISILCKLLYLFIPTHLFIHNFITSLQTQFVLFIIRFAPMYANIFALYRLCVIYWKSLPA